MPTQPSDAPGLGDQDLHEQVPLEEAPHDEDADDPNEAADDAPGEDGPTEADALRDQPPADRAEEADPEHETTEPPAGPPA